MAESFQVTLESCIRRQSYSLMMWLFVPLGGSVTLFSYSPYLTWNASCLLTSRGGAVDSCMHKAITVTLVGLMLTAPSADCRTDPGFWSLAQ